MVVDGNGETGRSSEAKKRKFWLVLLGALALIIVGLVVAIVIVIVSRNVGKSGSDDENVTYNSPVYESYDKISDEISNKLAEIENPTSAELMEIYKTYLDEAQDEGVRALLAIDYYLIVMSSDSERIRRNEVIDGLMSADEYLKSVKSAMALEAAAVNYSDTELAASYHAIVNERLGGENVAPNDESQNESSDTNEQSSDNNEETAG